MKMMFSAPEKIVLDSQIKELIHKQMQLDTQDKLLKMRELEISDLKILNSVYQKTNTALTTANESLASRLDDVIGRELASLHTITKLERRLAALEGMKYE
jgi:hypothetical protein